MSEDQVNDRIKMMAPNKCATIIYTSGTTGNPKGALLSHDNIVYAVRNMGIGTAKFRFFKEKIVSYLPLSHIAALANDLFGSLGVGATTYFAQPDALKGSLLQTLKEVQPTLFFGVPRIWEKFQDQLESVINTTLTGNKLRLFKWAQTCSYNHFLAKFNNKRSFDFSFYLAKLLVFKKIHKKLGLDKCRLFISGAAPIKKETLEFFIKIAIPLTETYGMSESTGPHSIGTIQANRITSVGKLNEYNKTLVVRKQETDDLESGELCMNGRHIFMGYLNEELKTKETFDADNWLHTGDLAKIDSDGFIFITGRLKELIITAGGENIAPVPIEDRIKLELNKLVSNCILIGDKQRYLVVLICLKSNVNTDTGEPLDDLTNDCIAFLQSIGSKSTKVSDIVNHKDKIVYKEIENGLFFSIL